MMKCKPILPLIAFLVFGASCRGHQDAPPPYSRAVARVDEQVITEEELRFRYRLEREKFPEEFLKPASPGENDLTETKLLHQVLDKMIDDAVIISWGVRNDFVIPDDQLKQAFDQRQFQHNKKVIETMLEERHIPYGRWKDMVEDDIRVQYVMDHALSKKVVVSAGEIQSYYNKNQSEFAVDQQVRARHIVTDSQKKADEIHARLLKGENFAMLAVEHSISPERAKGGDLGYFSPGSFPKVFDDVCFKLEIGEMSPVVKSEYGYHIFKVLDKKPKRTKELTEVAAVIEQELFEKKLQAAYQPWLEEIRKDVHVEIDQDLLDHFTF
jgi:peptidyl-prolyl cis-trans isomerase C